MSQAIPTAAERVLTEDPLTLTEAADEIRDATGIRPSRSTLTRWIHRGVGGVRLEAARVGIQFVTSRQAITRFINGRTE